MTPEKLKAARQLFDARQHTIAEIAATLGVSRASIYRSLNDTAAGRPLAHNVWQATWDPPTTDTRAGEGRGKAWPS
jgi:DNA invertase Pin-like site-specific DNA recombinase